VRIEQRSTVIGEFPKSDGRCTSEGARAAAARAQCTKLLVITGVKEGELSQ